MRANAETESMALRRLAENTAEDRVFSTNTNGVLLPSSNFSVFIKDQEKGDIKRLKSYAADGKSNPQFNLSSYANAYYCGGDSIKVYESWYA